MDFKELVRIMSWEASQYEKTCYCGKGKVLVTVESDDWNRSRSFETILCEGCKEKAEKDRIIKEERTKKYMTLVSKVILYFKNRYLYNWISYFNNVKSKKEIWNILKNINLENCSLQTFYKKCKTLTNSEYLESLITLENTLIILKFLNIRDLEFEEMIVEPLEIHKQIKNEHLVEYLRK
jgi:hypothetical protein